MLSSICRPRFESFVRDKILDDPVISALRYEVVEHRTPDGAINYPKSDRSCELLIEIKNLVAQNHTLAEVDETTGEVVDYHVAMQAIMKCRPGSDASLWTHRDRAAVELAKLYMPNLAAEEAFRIESWEGFDVSSHASLMTGFRPLAVPARMVAPELERLVTLCASKGDPSGNSVHDGKEVEEARQALGRVLAAYGEREATAEEAEPTSGAIEREAEPRSVAHDEPSSSLEKAAAFVPSSSREEPRSSSDDISDLGVSVHSQMRELVRKGEAAVKDGSGPERAEAYFREALALGEKHFGPDYPLTVDSQSRLGAALELRGDHKGALELFLLNLPRVEKEAQGKARFGSSMIIDVFHLLPS